MLIFDPPELEGQLNNAIQRWLVHTGISIREFGYEVIDPSTPDFDPTQYVDEVLTRSTEIYLNYPSALVNSEESNSVPIETYGGFIDFVEELDQLTTIGNLGYRSHKRFIVRIYMWPQTIKAIKSGLTEEMLLLDEPIRVFLLKKLSLLADCEERSNAIQDLAFDNNDVLDEYLRLNETIENTKNEILECVPFSRDCTKRYLPAKFQHSGNTISCSLLTTSTTHGLFSLATGHGIKPVHAGGDYDLAIEITGNPLPDSNVIQNAVEAYLFELSAIVGFCPNVIPIGGIKAKMQPELLTGVTVSRELPKMMIGTGMSELLRLYNSAETTSDLEIKILFFAKTIEYVSRTVLRRNLIESLIPSLTAMDLNNISATDGEKIEEAVEANRKYSKDRDATRLTIRVCCDHSTILAIAPPFLSPKSSKKTSINREAFLKDFSFAISDTRNSIAHAKANYVATGKECPEKEIEQFVECVRLASQQVIRWYGSQSEAARVS